MATTDDTYWYSRTYETYNKSAHKQDDCPDNYVFRYTCRGNRELYDLLVQAVGEHTIERYLELQKNSSSFRNTFSFSARNNEQNDEYSHLGNCFDFLATWLEVAINENLFWLNKRDETGKPTKLQGNLQKALKDARKWLHREHCIGHPLPYSANHLAQKVFGFPISKPEKTYTKKLSEAPPITLEYPSDIKRYLTNHSSFSSVEELAKAHIKNLGGKFEIIVRSGYGLSFDSGKGSIEILIGGCGMDLMHHQNGQVVSADIRYKLKDRTAFTGPTGTLEEGTGAYKVFFKNYLNVCEKLGIERIEIQAGDVGAYAWLRYGYLPNQEDWENLRTNLSPRLRKYKNQLSENTVRIIEEALKSDDPKAAWLIADQREEVDGKPIGFQMLYFGDVPVWWGHLDLTDPDCVERAKAYISNAPETIPAPSPEAIQEAELSSFSRWLRPEKKAPEEEEAERYGPSEPKDPHQQDDRNGPRFFPHYWI